MATALVITGEPSYGSICYSAFRQHDLLPVVVRTVEDAVPLLRQFKADVIVHHAPAEDSTRDPLQALAQHASGTPIVVVAELPPPHALALRARDAIDGELTTRREPAIDRPEGSSFSPGGSSA